MNVEKRVTSKMVKNLFKQQIEKINTQLRYIDSDETPPHKIIQR